MVNKERPNLANTWKYCKAMWRWIADNYDGGCMSCPGRKVDPRFTCTNPTYSYADIPREFYNKIRRMDYRRNKK